jgi:hypothetical protein
MSEDSYIPPTEAQLRRSLLIEAAAYIEEGNGFSPDRAASLVPRLREEAEAGVPVEIELGAYFHTLFGDGDRTICLWVRQASARFEVKITPKEAEQVQGALNEAIIAAMLDLTDSDPDPEVVALYRQDVLRSARTVAAFFGREVYIYLPSDGTKAILTPDCAPETDLYLRVDPDGSTRLTDER